MSYFIWIPLLVLYYIFFAWLSIKNNNKNESWWWFSALIITQAFGIWPLVSKYSNRLFFDAVLFDIIIVFSFLFGMILFGAGQEFKIHQWLGVTLAIAGLVLMKMQFN